MTCHHIDGPVDLLRIVRLYCSPERHESLRIEQRRAGGRHRLRAARDDLVGGPVNAEELGEVFEAFRIVRLE